MNASGMLIVIVHPELWNGGADRCTLGMIRHFTQTGHRVVWYTTMIDKYWENENFGDVGKLHTQEFSTSKQNFAKLVIDINGVHMQKSFSSSLK